MELETLSNGNDIENIIIISNIPMQYDIIGRYFVVFIRLHNIVSKNEHLNSAE